MEPEKQIEIQDSSFPVTTVSSMQVSLERQQHQQQPCKNNNNLRQTSCSEIDIDIEDETSATVKKDHPLPIYLKFVGVEYKARIKQISSKNAVNVLVSKVGLKMNGIKQKINDNNKNNHKYKQILKGISGSICPGEILALMGPSGSGKTSLLKIIGGRLRENVKGSITYNDIPYNPALKRRIGFVTQDDVLFPQLTVEETLIFSAFLRLSNHMSRCQKYQKVDMIIKELGLERCRHTQIGGGFLRGLSGGERKRTSIAYEILVDPSLLLLDEPTSGLDSSSANKLLQILQGVAQAGRTIITTIHQPSSRMFHTFDKVLLISEGCPIYHGEARRAMDYFSSLRFIPEIAMNPAEFLLDLATGQVKDISIPEVLAAAAAAGQGISPEYERLVIRYLQEEFKVQLDLDPVLGGERNRIYHQMLKAPEYLQSAIQIKKDRTTTWLDQFIVLSKRTFRMRYREYFDVFQLVQALGVSVLLGLLWWKSNISTEAQLRDQVGLMFYICIFWTYTSIFEAMFVFPTEKLYLVKERKADMYRLSVYYVCSTMCDMVAHLLNPTLFTSILYFMAGLKRTPKCFFLTLAAVLLISITSHGAGELSGAAVMSIKRTGTLASSVLMLFLLTGGYYVQHMPVFMEWMRYVSFMHYGYKLLLKVQYSGDDLYECESKGGCRKLQSSPTFSTVNLNGGLEEFWILLAMAIAYRIFAYIFLRQNINGFHL